MVCVSEYFDRLTRLSSWTNKPEVDWWELLADDSVHGRLCFKDVYCFLLIPVLSLNTDGLCSVCVHCWLIGADDKMGVLWFFYLVLSLSPPCNAVHAKAECFSQNISNKYQKFLER